MKQTGLLIGIVLGVLLYFGYDLYQTQKKSKCLFLRDERCITCDTDEVFPVGYKSACDVCENREAHYVEGGLFPTWQCVKKMEKEYSIESSQIELSSQECPEAFPLKDILGNCYPCDTELSIQLSHAEEAKVCGLKRYLLPDQLVMKSVYCPSVFSIQDPEVCVQCGYAWQSDQCHETGENRFCKQNSDCSQNEWCYSFKMPYEGGEGVCVSKKDENWFCAQTDGYDLNKTQSFCERQGAHIPTLQEIEETDVNLEAICPTLDMWTFFDPDGVVWLESFAQEFLFTRERESERLGGNGFYALCHKD